MPPLSPAVVVPVLRWMEPLRPAAPALKELTKMEPLVVLVLDPLVRTTLPPAAVSAPGDGATKPVFAPAEITTSPPAPSLPDPAAIVTKPPLPPVPDPLRTDTAPELAALASPL